MAWINNHRGPGYPGPPATLAANNQNPPIKPVLSKQMLPDNNITNYTDNDVSTNSTTSTDYDEIGVIDSAVAKDVTSTNDVLQPYQGGRK